MNSEFYNLGCIYGKLCTILPKWDTLNNLSNATRLPIVYVGRLVLQAHKDHLVTPEIEDFLADKYQEVSTETEIANATQQGEFILGYYQGKTIVDVKTLVDKSGLTQQEIADKLGVTRLTINRWYNGLIKPSYEKIKLLEKLLIK